MRVVVVTDTHGRIEPFLKSMNEQSNIDAILHLGDMVQDGKEISKKFNIPVHIVRGNNDYIANNTPWTLLLRFNGYKVLLTHGHRQGVNFGVENLLAMAKESEVDIILFGHTHVYYYREVDGIKILNPGSAGFDRGGEYESYAIIDFDKDISVKRIQI